MRLRGVMAHKNVVFVHHDQRSGRLSHDSAAKVWAHISRRPSEIPRQRTFKHWRPPDARLKRETKTAEDVEREMKVAFSSLQQLYAARSALQPVQSPESLYRLEASFFIAHDYCQSSALRPAPSDTRDYLQNVLSAPSNEASLH